MGSKKSEKDTQTCAKSSNFYCLGSKSMR